MIKKTEKVTVYWKTDHAYAKDIRWDTEEEAEAHELRAKALELKRERSQRAIDVFKGVREDSQGYWPQNSTMRGQGDQHVFATTETMRDWLVTNENLVMNFYNKLDEVER